MPNWVNFSAAWAKVVAVSCAALVRSVSASVALADGAEVGCGASAPLATEAAARSSWRIMPPSSSSRSSRISLAESGPAAGAFGYGGWFLRFRHGDRLGRSRLRLALPEQPERHGLLAPLRIEGA